MKEEFQKLLDKTYRPETWNPAASELKEDTTRSNQKYIDGDRSDRGRH